MIYGIRQSTQFKKDFKQCIKRGLDIRAFETVVELLRQGAPLPEKYLDHPLRPSRDFKNCRELHIEPDWLLIYKYSNETVILYLVRTGTHNDLFRQKRCVLLIQDHFPGVFPLFLGHFAAGDEMGDLFDFLFEAQLFHFGVGATTPRLFAD